MDFPGKEHLPTLGVGLSFRPEIAGSICEHLEEFDFLEVMLDNALRGVVGPRLWRMLAERLPLVGHGVNSSLGSLGPLDTQYLLRIGDIARRMGCKWFSDHLAFTHSGEVSNDQLMPVQFSAENADRIAHNIRAACDLLHTPFLLENISYYFTIPGSTLLEAEFIVRILEKARCGMLLDVNNLYANALNHGYDPYAFIDHIPCAAVVEIHVAGGEMRNGLYIDSHGHAVSSDVLALLDYAVATKKPKALVLEREKNFPTMQELLGEVRELRRVWVRHLGSANRPSAALA